MTFHTSAIIAVGLFSLGLAGCNGSAESGSAAQSKSAPGMPAAVTPRALPGVSQPAEHMAHGTINSIDNADGTVNISHGAVASASWPAMTMTFKLGDRSAAANLRPGQEVDFRFTIESGMSATVTQITAKD